MAKRKKQIACLFLSCYLIASNFCIAKAEALPDVMSGSNTIADIVLSYYAQAGAAISNLEWINALRNDLGESFGTIEQLAQQGYMVLNDAGNWEPVQALETAIENTGAYTSLGLDQVFNVSSAEVAAGGGAVVATGAGTLAGAAAGCASTGVLPLLGGVTAAYWAGIGIGTIASHLLGLYDEPIAQGVPVTSKEVLSHLPAGTSTAVCYLTNSYQGYNNSTAIWYESTGKPVNFFYAKVGESYYVVCQTNNYDGYLYLYLYANKTNGEVGSWNYSRVTARNNFASTIVYAGDVHSPFYPVLYYLQDIDAFNSLMDGFRNGTQTPKPKFSPDIVGQNGNLKGTLDNGNVTVPDLLPQIDPSVEAGKPISITDWLNFANQANTNTAAGQEDSNKNLYDDLLDLIKIAVSPSPDPNPNPYPDPNPNPDPTVVPRPDYDVENETQPDWENETTASTEQVPDSIPTGKPWVVQGLENKFPFCIPWDIKNCFSKLNSGSREAPRISWHFESSRFGIDYTFELDLDDFEDVATLMRTLELIAFIVGLAFVTRYLIGAT